MTSPYVVIAIDGPSASGKSTLARALAKRLKFYYLDTGAMYRAFAWKLLQEKVTLRNKKKIVEFCKKQRIKFTKTGGNLRIFINGKNVSKKIRTQEISEAASIISKIVGVRKLMTHNQRKFSRGKKVILEGRDIGTVVFPKATCKIFLVASLEERVNRRRKEFLDKGINLGKNRFKKDLIRRDTRDSSRNIAPLKKAKDAVLLDTTNLSISAMTQEALKIISRKIRLNAL